MSRPARTHPRQIANKQKYTNSHLFGTANSRWLSFIALRTFSLFSVILTAKEHTPDALPHQHMCGSVADKVSGTGPEKLHATVVSLTKGRDLGAPLLRE